MMDEEEVWALLRESVADQMEMEGSEAPVSVLMMVELVPWAVMEGWV